MYKVMEKKSNKGKVYAILYYSLLTCIILGMLIHPEYLKELTVSCYILLIGNLVIGVLKKNLSFWRAAFLIIYATFVWMIR